MSAMLNKKLRNIVCLVLIFVNQVFAESKFVQSHQPIKNQSEQNQQSQSQKTKDKQMTKSKYDPVTCEFPKDDEALQKLLTPEQYAITKKNGTEKPFANAYWNNHHHGIYVDIISKEPLFSSKDKFDSSSGWPSFTQPLKKDVIIEKSDSSHGMSRVEIRSKRSDAHLGHVFDDGPADRGGMRYCMNSASLKFIPLENMKAEGYEDWLKLFTADEIKQAERNPYQKK